VYACNCNQLRTLPEIYPLFLVCKPRLELSTWHDFLLDTVSIEARGQQSIGFLLDTVLIEARGQQSIGFLLVTVLIEARGQQIIGFLGKD